MERYSKYVVVCARILMSMVFLLNGFGIINQAIPAKAMLERGVPAAVVPFAMLAGRLVEIVAGFGLALGIFPQWCALALAIPARYTFHLAGGWRRTYVITAIIALYLNVFVLIVQLFEKVPALKAMAPTQSEPAFKLTQLVVLALFVVLAVIAVFRFRNERLRTA